MTNYLKFIFSIIICQLAGITGSLFTQNSLGWYYTLNKPFLRPPDWLFAPVWITLYAIMGISLYLVWKKGFSQNNSKYAIILFFVQLVFNAMWSVIFFGERSILGGLVVILVLWILIFLTIFAFSRVNLSSAYLLVPYLIWVSYASILNFSIWRLN
jgi:benzodiazapine receptor